MKIVVLDGYTLNPGDISWCGLEKLGDVVVHDRITTNPKDVDLIVKTIGDAPIVFTNKTPMTREIMTKLKNLKFIGVMATGFNVIDIVAAKELGIVVSNVPIYGTNAVAQTAIGLLLEMCHHIGEHNKLVHEGAWSRCPDYSFWTSPLIELADKTMGIVGLGRIGYATAKLAMALGMNVLAYDEYQNKALECDQLKYVSFDELLNKSDVISLHCPQTATNTGIINKNAINKMKEGVMIINTSRGPLINEPDLIAALDSGKIGSVALDVICVEPISVDNPLLKAKNCILTPHISWAPMESRARLMGTLSDNLKAFMDGHPINVVNK